MENKTDIDNLIKNMNQLNNLSQKVIEEIKGKNHILESGIEKFNSGKNIMSNDKNINNSARKK